MMSKNNEQPIRVVLVDDHLAIHRIVDAILQTVTDIELVGQAANGQEGLDLCEQLHPDLVLMDVMMPVMNGIEATRQLHKKFPGLKLLVLSSFQDHDSVFDMLNNGASGYITKTSLAQDLLDTIRATHHGKMVFSSEVITQIMTPRGSAIEMGAKTNFNLTQRELEVLALMAKGLNMPEMAARLTISQSTVKFHIENICHKMGVESRSEALVLATKNNLV